ncbi:hypothetical protein ACFQXB_00675 [Plastorhodobacter daqingensis]|uniref:Uncharacterized protein n=1 Tax=Plastorhodobacter daqingensis TaxID=1387281 RepID=A0ABW2UFE2_9RHOB
MRAVIFAAGLLGSSTVLWADCPASLVLEPAPDGMIALDLHWPCRAGERAVVTHEGLTFAGLLDEEGVLSLDVPALGTGAVGVLMPDGARLLTEVDTPVESFNAEWFVLQWQGGDDLRLEAEGVAPLLLGDADAPWPMLAAVVPIPSGDPDLRAVAPVTRTTCGTEVLAETVQVRDGVLLRRDLTIAMPGCDAIGQGVVVPGLLDRPRLN